LRTEDEAFTVSFVPGSISSVTICRARRAARDVIDDRTGDGRARVLRHFLVRRVHAAVLQRLADEPGRDRLDPADQRQLVVGRTRSPDRPAA
jgi:hypothetical protein